MNQENDFSFNKETHIYRLNNKIIPSVTQVLQAEGITDYSYADESDREWGQAGHKITELWDRGVLDKRTVSKPLIPCLEAWKKFLSDFKVKVILDWIERPICSHRYRYGVTPDRLCLIDGIYTLVELKFASGIQKGTRIQLAAQKIAVTEYLKTQRIRRWALQITKEGKGIPHFFNNKADESIWISAINLWRFRDEN